MTIVAQCSAGKKVIGGGIQNFQPESMMLTSSVALGTTEWAVQLKNVTNAAVFLPQLSARAYAICVTG